MTEKRFTLGKKWIAEGTIVEILDDEKVIICCFDNTLCDENPTDLVDLLNEQHEIIQDLKMYKKSVSDVLNSYLERDLVPIERIIVTAIAKELGVDFE